MERLFSSVLLLSCVGAVVSVILLLLKPITKKIFGSQWQYYIWFCVLVIMVLPVSFNIPVATDIYVPFTQSSTPSPTTIPLEQEVEVDEISNENTGDTVVPETIPKKKVSYVSIFKVLSYVWILGAGIFFVGGIISYIRFLRTVKRESETISCPRLEEIKRNKGIKREIRVKSTQMLNAPLMVGIFRPILLLPNKKVNGQELDFILHHELTHFKRCDLLLKWFSFLVNSFHWFNPFVYMVVKQINEECEISCDLSVTKNLSEDDKKGYMNTIINLSKEE